MTWHDTLPWEDGEKYEKQLETERDRVAAADIAKLRLIKIDTKYGITYKQYRWWDRKYAELMCPMLQSEHKQLCGKARIGRVIAPVERAIDELGEVMTANGVGSPATHNDVQARRIGVASPCVGHVGADTKFGTLHFPVHDSIQRLAPVGRTSRRRPFSSARGRVALARPRAAERVQAMTPPGGARPS